MPPKPFPLRWESTGDQWWFASPIDWAAANGLYDLVRQLLQIDGNLLIKLTSLPRIRRLESVWPDDHHHFNDVAKCRAHVARNLLHDCETEKGYNSLIRAGYGGWLLYTAAAAGDVVFVKELLDKDPHLVFGGGEYGVTDMLYAAARSKSGEVFKLVFDCCVAPVEVSPVFRWEMMNRAVHAAARGGNVAVLAELLGDGGDVLAFRDAMGSTVLHTAAGRGQVQVIEHLISSYDIINSIDDRGNSALTVAAYFAHLPSLKLLASASPSSASLANNHGDTLLHMAVAGFRSPSFRRLDLQMELMAELVRGSIIHIDSLINVRNNDGRTPLHIAVMENVHSDAVELLLSVRCIDLNARDSEGNTPLDLLYLQPRAASSELLIKRMVSSGGVSGDQDRTTRNLVVRMRGIGGSPGTSFRIPDAEIALHTGIEENYLIQSSCELTDFGYSGEIGSSFATPECSTSKFRKSSSVSTTPECSSSKFRKSSSMSTTTRRLKNILLRKKSSPDDNHSADSCPSPKTSPIIPLRQQFSRESLIIPNNKRILSLQGNLPSPSAKKKLHNVRQVLPKSNLGSPLSAFSESSWPSPISIDARKNANSAGPASSSQSPDVEKMKMKTRHSSFSMGLMNDYFCFGGHGLAVEDSIHAQGQNRNQQSLVDVG